MSVNKEDMENENEIKCSYIVISKHLQYTNLVLVLSNQERTPSFVPSNL